MSALGERLRLAREARGLSLSDVSEKIHIRSVYLDALERGEFGVIGAPVYARGFIRTYARFLNIDPEAAIADFEGELGKAAPSAPAGAADRRSATTVGTRPGPSLLVWALSVVAIGLVGYAGYNVYEWKTGADGGVSTPRATAAPPAAPVAQATEAAQPVEPSVTPPPTPSPKPSPSYNGEAVEMHWSEPSWVRVDVDGANQMEGVFPAGTTRTFHGRRVTVRVGNAGGVELVVNGKNTGKLGADGDVVERTFKVAQE